MASAFTPFEKRIFVIVTALVPIALVLAQVHSAFIILTIPFCFGLFFENLPVGRRPGTPGYFPPCPGYFPPCKEPPP